MEAVINSILGVLWSNWMIYLVLGAGLYFSIRTRFGQVRLIKRMINLVKESEASAEGISSMQAFALSLSARVGTGNIVGVVTAIAMGGPGAVFWMWVLAFLGAGTSFVESVLSQVYKEERSGQYRGGIAYYMKHGTGNKYIGYITAAIFSFSTLILMPGVQSNAITESLYGAFGWPQAITGLVVAVALGSIIFGGVKRIAKVAQFLVPIMATFYLVVVLIILIINIKAIPATFALIFSSAFGVNPVFGGIVGTAISMGVKRGIYSSEAGMGTATQHSAAAEVSHPIKQGLVQSLSVYVDTLIVCTATALLILVTNSYNVVGPDGGFLVQNLTDVPIGPMYTQIAAGTLISPTFGSIFVGISLSLFAFTSLTANYYVGETNVVMFINNKSKVLNILKVVYIIISYYSCLNATTLVWAISDVGIGLIVWINLIGILFLSNIVFKIFKDYEEQISQGLEPVFDPEKLGIKNADLWKKINSKNINEALKN